MRHCPSQDEPSPSRQPGRSAGAILRRAASSADAASESSRSAASRARTAVRSRSSASSTRETSSAASSRAAITSESRGPNARRSPWSAAMRSWASSSASQSNSTESRYDSASRGRPRARSSTPFNSSLNPASVLSYADAPSSAFAAASSASMAPLAQRFVGAVRCRHERFGVFRLLETRGEFLVFPLIGNADRIDALEREAGLVEPRRRRLASSFYARKLVGGVLRRFECQNVVGASLANGILRPSVEQGKMRCGRMRA